MKSVLTVLTKCIIIMSFAVLGLNIGSSLIWIVKGASSYVMYGVVIFIFIIFGIMSIEKHDSDYN
jgi:hypothetical protein